jgi:hypothetical protein
MSFWFIGQDGFVPWMPPSNVPSPAARDKASVVREIVDHIGESTRPPSIAPARGPPLWEAATAAEQARYDPQWDLLAQPVSEAEFDQRIAW